MAETLSSKQTRAIIVVAGLVIGLLATDNVLGMRRVVALRAEISTIQAVGATRATIEQRITEWIVRRNPSATIADFQDFPVALLREAQAADIDVRLLMALIDKESEFNPRAVGRAGEVGLMQVMPATAAAIAKAKGWKYEPPSARRSDGGYASLGTLGVPRENIRFGVAFLRDQVAQFGVSPAALRAYNRGPGSALESRPQDRYAEDIGLRLVALTKEIR
jgi:soluble lytic murein transglycosylase-like protein